MRPSGTQNCVALKEEGVTSPRTGGGLGFAVDDAATHGRERRRHSWGTLNLRCPHYEVGVTMPKDWRRLGIEDIENSSCLFSVAQLFSVVSFFALQSSHT